VCGAPDTADTTRGVGSVASSHFEAFTYDRARLHELSRSAMDEFKWRTGWLRLPATRLRESDELRHVR